MNKMPKNKIQVVPLAGEHLEELSQMDKVRLGSRFTPQKLKEKLQRDLELCRENPKTHFHLVAVLESALAVPIGHLAMKLAGDEASIQTLVVQGTDEGKGVATQLILEAAKLARKSKANSLGLEVRVGNKRAQKIYSRFGLAPVGMRKGYYPANKTRPKEDAVLLWNHEVQSPDFLARLEKIAKKAGVEI